MTFLTFEVSVNTVMEDAKISQILFFLTNLSDIVMSNAQNLQRKLKHKLCLFLTELRLFCLLRGEYITVSHNLQVNCLKSRAWLSLPVDVVWS